MSEIPAIERALLEAAQRRYPRRRRTTARAGAGLLAVAALVVALAWVFHPLASERADERSACGVGRRDELAHDQARLGVRFDLFELVRDITAIGEEDVPSLVRKLEIP